MSCKNYDRYGQYAIQLYHHHHHHHHHRSIILWHHQQHHSLHYRGKDRYRQRYIIFSSLQIERLVTLFPISALFTNYETLDSPLHLFRLSLTLTPSRLQHCLRWNNNNHSHNHQSCRKLDSATTLLILQETTAPSVKSTRN